MQTMHTSVSGSRQQVSYLHPCTHGTTSAPPAHANQCVFVDSCKLGFRARFGAHLVDRYLATAFTAASCYYCYTVSIQTNKVALMARSHKVMLASFA